MITKFDQFSKRVNETIGRPVPEKTLEELVPKSLLIQLFDSYGLSVDERENHANDIRYSADNMSIRCTYTSKALKGEFNSKLYEYFEFICNRIGAQYFEENANHQVEFYFDEDAHPELVAEATIIKPTKHKPDLTKTGKSIAAAVEPLISAMGRMSFPEIKDAFKNVLNDTTVHASAEVRAKWNDVIAKSPSKFSLMNAITNLYLKAAGMGVREAYTVKVGGKTVKVTLGDNAGDVDKYAPLDKIEVVDSDGKKMLVSKRSLVRESKEKLDSGDWVTVATDLTNDPYNKKGELGQVVRREDDDTVSVWFDDDNETIGLYSDSALLKSKEYSYEVTAATENLNSLAHFGGDKYRVRLTRYSVIFEGVPYPLEEFKAMVAEHMKKEWFRIKELAGIGVSEKADEIDYAKLSDEELMKITDPKINKGAIPFKAVKEMQRRFPKKYTSKKTLSTADFDADGNFYESNARNDSERDI